MPLDVIAKRGYRGPNVERLQRALNKIAGAGLEPDGWFGTNTEAAVIAFQKDNGFLPDGVVGPFTNAAITLVPFVRHFPAIPPHITQDPGTNECWAAATAGWLAVQPARTHYTKDQIIEGFKADGVANADGSLPVSSESAWEARMGLRGLRETGATFFAERALQRMTFTNKPILVGLADKVGHIVVCFGVAVAGMTPQLITMDPLKTSHPANLDISVLRRTGTTRVMTWVASGVPLFP